jgi:N-methylhydantoinase B
MVSQAHPLRGLCGGEDAGPYSNRFEVGTPNEYKIELSARAQLPAGAVIAYQHGGGAGFEPALLRDPDAVKDDVLDELVSLAAAREKYGVVFTGSVEDYDLAVDGAATTALRQKMSAARAA